MWINGKFLVKNGITGKDKTTSTPQYLPLIKMFKPVNDRIEVVIHVSNFQYAHGGIWKSILFGNESKILKLRRNSIIFEMFLSGALLAMGIYHIGLYMLYKKEYAMLYFGIFCLIIMIRTCLTGERLLLGFFPGFQWETAFKIELLPVFLGRSDLGWAMVAFIFPYFGPLILAFLSEETYKPGKGGKKKLPWSDVAAIYSETVQTIVSTTTLYILPEGIKTGMFSFKKLGFGIKIPTKREVFYKIECNFFREVFINKSGIID